MNKKKNKGRSKRGPKRLNPLNKPAAKGVSTYPVEAEAELLPFLLSVMSNRSRNSVKSILTRGQVTVDGHPVTKHNHPLKPGNTVAVLSNKEALKQSELIGMSIIHEDKDLIVVNKGAGLLSIAANDPTEMTAYSQLSEYVKKENPNNKIFVVHRLDRDTSGVMLYAKSEEIKEKLQSDWKNTVKERIYTALVEGTVQEEQGKMASWLKENKAMKIYSESVDDGGKYAVTHYRKVRGNENYSLLELELETGRKHQIRVHLQDLGHPVVGDKQYGAETNALKRLGLHATTLVLVHPGTNKLVRYTAEVPSMFLKLSR